MDSIVMAKDVIDLPLFKNPRINNFNPIGNLDVPYLSLDVFWELRPVLDVASKWLNDSMRDRAYEKVVEVLAQKQSGGVVFHALLDGPEIDEQMLFTGLKPFDAQKFVSEFWEYPFQMSLHLGLS